MENTWKQTLAPGRFLVGKPACSQNGKFPHIGRMTDDGATTKFSSNRGDRRDGRGNRKNMATDLDHRDGSPATGEPPSDSGALTDAAEHAGTDHHRVSTARFQRKPEYVDAVQLTQETVDAHVLDGAPLPDGCRLTSARCHRGNRTVEFAAVRLIIPRHELVMPGDWIVRTFDGKFCVYRPDDFEATYEAVRL